MADIFLSYASGDRERVFPLVDALQRDGFSVWWDRDIRPGPSFDREIEQAIDSAACMVVVWSARSVESEWVRSEVDEGVRRGMLVPVAIDPVAPPLAYRRRQTADLSDWDGERDGEYAQLLAGIRATLEGAGTASHSPETTTRPTAIHSNSNVRTRARKRRVSIRAAAVLVVLSGILAGSAGLLLGQRQDAPSKLATAGVVRLQLLLPEGQTVRPGISHNLNITPDGQTITFVASDDRESGYFVRRLTDIQSRRLDPLSRQLGSHWLSADGKSLIYNDIESRAYRKIGLDGGPSTPVVNLGTRFSPRGLSESSDGRIAFASSHAGISLVSAPGAEAIELTSPEAGITHSAPQFSPDGSLLFISEAEAEKPPAIRAYDFATGALKTIASGERALLTKSGHLVLLRDGALLAAPFVREDLSLARDPVLILEGLNRRPSNFAVAENGTLVYLPEPPSGDRRNELMWVSRDGTSVSIPLAFEMMGFPRIAPDESSLVFHASTRSTGADLNIWNYSFDKGTISKLSFSEDPQQSVVPSWTTDSNTFVYLHLDGSTSNGNLFLGYADGARPARQVTSDGRVGELSTVPGGGTVLTVECSGISGCDLASLNLADDAGGAEVLLATPFEERSPELSPDGRWLAYASDQSGRFEVYVRPYTDIGSRRWQVSTNGGQVPMWSKSGDRLYFVEPDTNELVEAMVATGEDFNWATPEVVLDLEGYDWGDGPRDSRNFDVSSDNELFVLVRQVRQQIGIDHLVVVLNWFDELERLAPLEGQP